MMTKSTICIFPEGGNELYTVYHGRIKQTDENRVVFIDEMEILEDGKLLVHGPTTSPKPHPLENIAD